MTLVHGKPNLIYGKDRFWAYHIISLKCCIFVPVHGVICSKICTSLVPVLIRVLECQLFYAVPNWSKSKSWKMLEWSNVSTIDQSFLLNTFSSFFSFLHLSTFLFVYFEMRHLYFWILLFNKKMLLFLFFTSNKCLWWMNRGVFKCSNSESIWEMTHIRIDWHRHN